MPSQNRKFKAVITSEASLGARKEYTVNLRKKSKEQVMTRRRFQSVDHENQASNTTTMPWDVALKYITTFNRMVSENQQLSQQVVEQCLEATKTFRRAIGQECYSDKICEIVPKGLLDAMLGVLNIESIVLTNQPSFREEVGFIEYYAACFLADFTYSNAVIVLENHNALRLLRDVIQSSSFPPVREACIHSVANMLGLEDGVADYRLKYIQDESFMSSLFCNITQPPTPKVLKATLWALGNLFEGSGSDNIRSAMKIILYNFCSEQDKLNTLPVNQKDEILVYFLSTIYKGMKNGTATIDLVGNYSIDEDRNFLSLVVKMAEDAYTNNDKVCFSVWRIFALFSQSNQHLRDILLEMGVMKKYAHAILRDRSVPMLFKEVLWTVNNLLDSQKGFEDFERKRMISDVVQVAHYHSYGCKIEALPVICKYLDCIGREELQHLLHHNYVCTEGEEGFDVLFDYLGAPGSIHLTLRILNTVEKMLRTDKEYDYYTGATDKITEKGRIEKIEDLQNSQDKSIFHKAQSIILLFNDEDEDDETDNVFVEEPAVENGAFVFGTKRVPEISSPLISPEDRSPLSDNMEY